MMSMVRFGTIAVVAFMWLGGLFFIAHRQGITAKPTAIWTTSDEFPRGYQLKQGDLQPGHQLLVDLQIAKEATVVKKHLMAPTKKDAEIRGGDLMEFPPVTPETAEHYTWFTTLAADQALLAKALRPGDRIAFCFDETTGSNTRLVCVNPCPPVLAVHSAIDDKDTSWIAVQIPDNAKEALGRYLRASRKVILRANHAEKRPFLSDLDIAAQGRR